MTTPAPRSKYRKKVRDQVVIAHPNALSDVQADAISDHVWHHASDEAVFDGLLRTFVAHQRTWWETPTQRTG